MTIIEVSKLSKKFKIKVKEKGLKGSLKSMFKPNYKVIKAVKNINFKIDKVEIISFSAVPALASTISLALIAQGIFILIKFFRISKLNNFTIF